MGYYGVFMGLQYQNNVAMTRSIDSNQYEESQTVTIKIPIAVPYMNDNAAFERVDGIFEYKGQYYRLVKQKYQHDTLTVVCIRDVENKRIHEAISSFVKTFTDKAADSHHGAKNTVSFIKDYIVQTFTIKSISGGWQREVETSGHSRHLIPSFIPSVIHPPERG